jgi:hypothetical protein
MIGFINTLFYNHYYSQSIITLSLIHPLQKSLGHTPFSSMYSSVLFCIPTAVIRVLQLTLIYDLRLMIYYLYSLEAVHRKRRFLYYCEGTFTVPLPSSRNIRCSGNVFSDPLSSSGSIHHNKFYKKNLLNAHNYYFCNVLL